MASAGIGAALTVTVLEAKMGRIIVLVAPYAK